MRANIDESRTTTAGPGERMIMICRGIVAFLAPQTFQKLAVRLLLACSACLAIAGRLEADPYYTVTDLGSSYAVNQQSGSLTNAQTGVSYPFVTTTTSLTPAEAERMGLPGGTILQDQASHPEMMPYTMSGTAVNNSGTAVGSIPTAVGYSDPWDTRSYGYALRSPDGQYSSFIPLLTNLPQGSGHLWLSQTNQILVYDNSHLATSLYDISTRTTTPVSQLISPASLQMLDQRFVGPVWFSGLGIDDRGDILVEVGGFDPSNVEEYLLSPAGSAETPEPSSLLVFGLFAGAMGVRSVLRRRVSLSRSGIPA